MQIVVIVSVARLTGAAVARMGQPRVVGEMVVMALVTTAMTTPALDLIQRRSAIDAARG